MLYRESSGMECNHVGGVERKRMEVDTHPSQECRLRHTRRSSEISLIAIRKDDKAAVVPETAGKHQHISFKVLCRHCEEGNVLCNHPLAENHRHI